MNWRYKVLGGHTHVRVFMNGAKCGDLCFRNEEFLEIYEEMEKRHTCVEGELGREIPRVINFIEDGETQPATGCEATDV